MPRAVEYCVCFGILLLAFAERFVVRSERECVCMQDDKQKKEELLELLRAELAKLLCADDVSEEEKLARITLAQAIIENGRGEV